MRRCRWCKLILDDKAPMGVEMIAQPKGDRKTRAHCTSPACDWCLPCKARREFEFRAQAADQ